MIEQLTSKQRYQKRVGAMEQERSSFVTHWQEIGRFVSPRGARFLVTDVNQGKKRFTEVIDNTAFLALRTLSSGMMGGITSPARPWFRLTTPDPDMADYGPVKVWLHTVESRMREIFSRSNLYNALPVMYGSLGAYGTAAMAALEDEKDIVRFYPFPIGSYCLAQDERHQVNTFCRKFRLSVWQTVNQFGIDNVSEGVKNNFKMGNFDVWVDITHVIEPNHNRVIGKEDSKNKAYRSVYFENSRDKEFLRESGFDDFPIMAPRWETDAEDIYGTSCPGMIALGDVKGLQLEQRRKVQAIDKIVTPPMVGPSSLKNQPSNLMPGGITYIDSPVGNQKFEPAYQVNPYLNHLVEDIREVQTRIKRAFYEDLFLLLAQDFRSGVTAREVEERHEEKMLMLGPVLERLNGDLLDPIIDRTFYLMLRAFLIPEPPEELQGQDLKVEYISIMAAAQKMIGTSAVERLASFTGSIMAANPQITDKVDWDQMVDEYSIMLGTPPSLVIPDERVTQIRAKRAQQENMARMAAAAKPALDGAKAAEVLSNTQVNEDNALTRALGMAAGAAPLVPRQ